MRLTLLQATRIYTFLWMLPRNNVNKWAYKSYTLLKESNNTGLCQYTYEIFSLGFVSAFCYYNKFMPIICLFYSRIDELLMVLVRILSPCTKDEESLLRDKRIRFRKEMFQFWNENRKDHRALASVRTLNNDDAKYLNSPEKYWGFSLNGKELYGYLTNKIEGKSTDKKALEVLKD